MKTTDDLIIEAGCKVKKWSSNSLYEYSWRPNGELIAKGACVETDYRPYFVPETGITKVYSTVERQRVRNVDAREESVSIDFTLVMRWLDPNINTNFTDKERAKGGITLDEKKANMIWNPDLYIFNPKSFDEQDFRIKSFKILTGNEFSQVDNRTPSQTRREKTTVEYSIEIKTTVYCKFYHRAYPVDTQMCNVTFGSKSLEAIFHLYDPNNTFHQVYKYEAVCFDMEITFFDEGHADGKNTIGFHIKMERIIQPFIWKYYIPCIAIVLVSGLSFIIPLSAIPGRVALLVTQFLSLINLFIFQMVSWKKILSSFKSNYKKNRDF